MNVFLWILQWVLAAAFFMAGAMKVTQPREKLVEQMDWVSDFSDGQMRVIGAAAVHRRRGETQMIVINLVLLVLAVIVAWGRFGPEAF